jgi:glutamate formiminotransferase / formiminotetrahydrofolate cyclodeaminase
MPTPIVECIPNFSEARRPDVVEAIVKSIMDVEGVAVLDRHSDLDHNRTVITFVGSPAAVEEAAFRSIARAGQLIDLNVHTGEHPRLGATDVVPFVPISDISMQECVEIARRLGKRVGTELSIPVYLYEDAATRPDRQNLENIRRGEYEALKLEIGSNPDRSPDFGPASVGPAGATVIGARQPLIAFNVYLTTPDISIAQKIARAIRSSNGGFRFVKALGLQVEGLAQVSMNLTNFRQSPIGRVVEMIRRETQRYGVGIHHSELVGLVPQEALNDAASWYLQLDDFQAEQILETRLYQDNNKRSTNAAVEPQPSFLDRLASGSPTPGGGSASAFTAAEAAALVAMVARLTVGKKKYASVEGQMWAIIDQAEMLRADLTRAVELDAAAFDQIMASMKMPKDSEAQQAARSSALEQATRQAMLVPLEVARKAIQIMELSLQTAANGNINAISDAGTSAALARAALTGAGLNVRTNSISLKDPSFAQPFIEELVQLDQQAASIDQELRKILIERGHLPL